MSPSLRFVLALSIAFAGLLFASAAEAQTCEERRVRMKAYEAQAQQLRESEEVVRTAHMLLPSRLEARIDDYRARLARARDPAVRRNLHAVLQHLVKVRSAANANIVGPSNTALMAQIGRERDLTAANISHSRAAMDSLGCGATAATDPRLNDPNATSASGCQGFSGVWNTNWAVVTFNGSTGSYVFRGINSSITGTIHGHRYSGSYHQPGFPDPEYTTGEVIFTLSADGESWAGESWNRSRTVMQPWSGTCAGPAR